MPGIGRSHKTRRQSVVSTAQLKIDYRSRLFAYLFHLHRNTAAERASPPNDVISAHIVWGLLNAFGKYFWFGTVVVSPSPRRRSLYFFFRLRWKFPPSAMMAIRILSKRSFFSFSAFTLSFCRLVPFSTTVYLFYQRSKYVYSPTICEYLWNKVGDQRAIMSLAYSVCICTNSQWSEWEWRKIIHRETENISFWWRPDAYLCALKRIFWNNHDKDSASTVKRNQ